MSDQTAPTYLDTRVHNHAPYRPMCNERHVGPLLRGACLNDDGTPVDAPTYLEPIRDELDRLRTLLDDRSAALNRTAASNDTLRAQIAAVENRTTQWGARAFRAASDAKRDRDEYLEGYADGLMDAGKDIRHDIRAAALAVPTDQEPAK